MRLFGDSKEAQMNRSRSATTWTSPVEAVSLLVRGVTVRAAGPVALLIGTVLSAVNQGSTLFNGVAD